jgi:hypothetical protein
VKRLILAASCVLAVSAPAALAATPTRAHTTKYTHLYREVARKFGKRTPGRNIVNDGVSSGRGATDAEVAKSITVLERMLAPPPVPSSVPSGNPAGTTSYGSTSVSSYSSAGASGVPACASESGTNYSTGSANTNASSGATGRYQIIPSTAAAYGCDLSTPAGQDSCAQAIYAHQGAGAWVGCGG